MLEEKKFKCGWCTKRFKTESERTQHHMLMKHWLKDDEMTTTVGISIIS